MHSSSHKVLEKVTELKNVSCKRQKREKGQMGSSWNIGTMHCFPMLQVLKRSAGFYGPSKQILFLWGRDGVGEALLRVTSYCIASATTWIDSICTQSILTNFLSVFGGHLISANVLHKKRMRVVMPTLYEYQRILLLLIGSVDGSYTYLLLV